MGSIVFPLGAMNLSMAKPVAVPIPVRDHFFVPVISFFKFQIVKAVVFSLDSCSS